jgi:hypothetical protein
MMFDQLLPKLPKKLPSEQVPSEYALASLFCKDKQLIGFCKEFAGSARKWSTPIAGKDMPNSFNVDDQINPDKEYCSYPCIIPGLGFPAVRDEVIAKAKEMFAAQGITLLVLRPYESKPVFVVPAETFTTDDGKRRMAAVYTAAKAREAQAGAAR